MCVSIKAFLGHSEKCPVRLICENEWILSMEAVYSEYLNWFKIDWQDGGASACWWL